MCHIAARCAAVKCGSCRNEEGNNEACDESKLSAMHPVLSARPHLAHHIVGDTSFAARDVRGGGGGEKAVRDSRSGGLTHCSPLAVPPLAGRSWNPCRDLSDHWKQVGHSLRTVQGHRVDEVSPHPPQRPGKSVWLVLLA